jgi:hypothetical protein
MTVTVVMAEGHDGGAVADHFADGHGPRRAGLARLVVHGCGSVAVRARPGVGLEDGHRHGTVQFLEGLGLGLGRDDRMGPQMGVGRGTQVGIELRVRFVRITCRRLPWRVGGQISRQLDRRA